MSIKKVVGLGALVAVATGVGFTLGHVHVTWGPGPAAIASPPPVIAETKTALPPPTPNQLADARTLSRTFSQVADQLGPSVVRISITKSARPGARGGNGVNPFRGSPFERFFGEEDGPFGGRGGQMPKQKGMGSGVVIDPKGFILTNNHVVEDADEVKVTFLDGKTVSGKVIGTDPKSDLAVVKVEGVAVKAARMGDSDKMAIGEWVIAIGNPLGLDHSVTVGVLSAKGRSGFHSGNYEDFLQTDASINPGNSGGPLVNLDGEIIGINTMIAQGTGIGFAVPSSMAKPISEQLIQGGKVRRPWLGIAMQDVTPELAKGLGDKAPQKGALVSQVSPGSPAQKAGVAPGDVIVTVDGSQIDGSRAVQKTVLGKTIGQKLDLTVWRDGKEQRLAAMTAELPGETTGGPGPTTGAAPAPEKLGIAVQTLTPDLAQRVGVDSKTKGAVITDVRMGSPAQEAGLAEGDVLVEIDRKAVTGASDATRLLTTPRAGGHLLRVRRADQSLFVVLPQN